MPADSGDASRAGPVADATHGTPTTAAKPLPTAVDATPAALPRKSPTPTVPIVSFQDLLADPDALTVNFKVDSNELTPEDMQDLDRIAALLKARDDIRAKVTGYTDAVGNLHYNLKVSEFRANIVKTYLVGKGGGGRAYYRDGNGAGQPGRQQRHPRRAAAQPARRDRTADGIQCLHHRMAEAPWDQKQNSKRTI